MRPAVGLLGGDVETIVAAWAGDRIPEVLSRRLLRQIVMLLDET
jgi:hypothetical protein